MQARDRNRTTRLNPQNSSISHTAAATAATAGARQVQWPVQYARRRRVHRIYLRVARRRKKKRHRLAGIEPLSLAYMRITYICISVRIVLSAYVCIYIARKMRRLIIAGMSSDDTMRHWRACNKLIRLFVYCWHARE